jgi:SAM-dependent methyltransferase
VSGIPILPPDLDRHFATHGNVYRRTPVADPRLTRFVLSRWRGGGDFVPFEEVVARYGDLLPEGERPAAAPAPSDRALLEALESLAPTLPRSGPALDVGCGVGRSAFVLAEFAGEAVGVDRSVARVRRARNVQSAAEFHLPPSGGGKERPIDLSRLRRSHVDFVVADAALLPFRDGAFSVVALHEGDSEGAFADAAHALREASRVRSEGGVVLVERSTPAGRVFSALSDGGVRR